MTEVDVEKIQFFLNYFYHTMRCFNDLKQIKKPICQKVILNKFII